MPTMPLNKPQLNETANNHQSYFNQTDPSREANQLPFRIYYNKKSNQELK